MDDKLFEQALEKGAVGERLDRAQAQELAAAITPDRLHALGRSALANRRRRHGDNATYVFNMHINPANICGAGCTFCNYAASKNAPHAYVLSEAEIFSRVEQLQPTEAHIVGGLNQVWPYARNLELVRQLRQRYPGLHIKGYTAVEIAYFAKTSGKNEMQILEELIDAGLKALPGGGAEIFSERLYRMHWKNKIGPMEWIRIHKMAHKLGLTTNATMLFGFGDTWAERIEHMLILREAQDASGGFTCFYSAGLSAGKRSFRRPRADPPGDLGRVGHIPPGAGQYRPSQILLAHERCGDCRRRVELGGGRHGRHHLRRKDRPPGRSLYTQGACPGENARNHSNGRVYAGGA